MTENPRTIHTFMSMNTDLLLLEFSNETFVLNTQKQLAKDFNQNGFSFSQEFSEIALTREEIEQAVAEQLMEIMRLGETKLLQLLYTIDLPEKEFLSILNTPNFLQALAAKVVFKEAYKVYLRNRFS